MIALFLWSPRDEKTDAIPARMTTVSIVGRFDSYGEGNALYTSAAISLRLGVIVRRGTDKLVEDTRAVPWTKWSKAASSSDPPARLTAARSLENRITHSDHATCGRD